MAENRFQQFAPKPQGNRFQQYAPLAGERTFARDPDEELYRQYLTEEQERFSKPQPPMPDMDEPKTAQEAAIRRVQQERAQQAEEEAFQETRTPFNRLTDTATTMLSFPIRTLTHGEYGLGDVAGLVSEEAGEIYTQDERDFARANQDWLEPLAAAGEATLGIPFLSSMGAVPGQIGRTAATGTQYLPRAGQRGQAARAQPTATPQQAYGPTERMADRAAFQAEGVPEFPPAFTSKGTARVARTIEELPLVGGTVKTPKRAVEQAMESRRAGLADELGAPTGPEDVGLVAQRGLDRFRTANLEDLDRTRMRGLGLPTERPPQRVQDSLAIDRPGQFSTANLTPEQLRTAAKSQVSLPELSRARVTDLSTADLNKIINRPARDTSFATKASALYKRAEDAVPRMFRRNETANPNMLAPRNARSVSRGIMQDAERTHTASRVTRGHFGEMLDRLSNAQRPMPLDTIRTMRTEIGRVLSNYGQYDVAIDKTRLKQLYGALSDDYQAGLVALAARARQNSKKSPNSQDYVPTRVADDADKALQRYRVADRYFRQGIERMDRFMNVLGAKTLEDASKRIGRYLKENTQDIRALETMASSLRPEEWRSILGRVVGDLGEFTPGAREAERIFSFERFATDWNKISQNPRTMRMFRRSLGDEVADSLNNLGRIAERMKFYETTQNYSGSAYTGFGGLGMAALFDPTLWPMLIGSIGGSAVAGKVLTSRSFAKWVNSLNRAQVKAGSSVAATGQALRPHLRRLTQLAAKEPDPQVSGAMRALAVSLERNLEAVTRDTGQPETEQPLPAR